MSFEEGISGPLKLILAYYSSLMDGVFEPIRPIAERYLKIINALIDMRLTLQDHWKHILVLMALYLGAQSRRTGWARGWRLYTLLKWITSVIIGGLVALLAGSANSESASTNIALLVVIPIAGLLMYEALSCAYIVFLPHRDELHFGYIILFRFLPLMLFILGTSLPLLIIIFVNQIGTSTVAASQTTGLAASAIMFLLILVYKLKKGLSEARLVVYEGAPEGVPIIAYRRFWATAAIFSEGGKEMAEVVAGVLLFLVANAGLLALGM